MTALVQIQEAGHVLAEVRNHIGHLTLNRPCSLNALTLDMIRTLGQQLESWAADPQVLAVMLRGAGPKGLCAGGDIRSLSDSYHAADSVHRDFFAEEHALGLYIHRYRKPVMVLMDGYTLGGGLGLAQAADLRIVTERSRLGMPEVGIGYFPDVGASYFLPRLPGELGIYLGVSGTHIGAADALYCGLADWHVNSARLSALDYRLNRLNFSHVPLKDLQGLLAKIGTQVLPEPSLDRLRPMIDHYFGLPDVPSMIEQLRTVTIGDSHPWALASAERMQACSPLAMAVTLDLLRRGRYMPLEDCFAMELHLNRRWFEHGELLEGVRARIIDKDRQPRWNPPTFASLERQQVQRFFEGL